LTDSLACHLCGTRNLNRPTDKFK